MKLVEIFQNTKYRSMLLFGALGVFILGVINNIYNKINNEHNELIAKIGNYLTIISSLLLILFTIFLWICDNLYEKYKYIISFKIKDCIAYTLITIENQPQINSLIYLVPNNNGANTYYVVFPHRIYIHEENNIFTALIKIPKCSFEVKKYIAKQCIHVEYTGLDRLLYEQIIMEHNRDMNLNIILNS